MELFWKENISMNDFHVKTPAQLQAALRGLRRAQGLNQSEFGRKVGLSQERISAIENHPERVTIDQLLTLLMAAGMELVIKPRTLGTSTLGSW
jgi:HTH-type transcriptional regulator / antitoxin HipB